VGSHRVVIGTRGSALALWQADHVAAQLRAAHPGLVVERKIIVTTGDRTGPVGEAGGKAVWVKEIEAALLAGEIDLAVHSLKDVPAELASGLVLAAIPARADVRDALISRDGSTLDNLPAGASVGTTSLRRICQVKALRPDLRLAGLDRLGLSQHIAERIAIERMLPAIGQGALAIEIRAADEPLRVVCRELASEDAEITVAAERTLLQHLGAGCRTFVAGTAQVQQSKLEVWGLVGSPDGATMLREHVSGAPSAAQSLGKALAEALIARGADRILAQYR
jgi:hydroxymethylbilane synthase